jgi:hypothetical protein
MNAGSVVAKALHEHTPMAPSHLDFGLLDAALPALLRSGDARARRALAETPAAAVGPLAEYAFQASGRGAGLPRLKELCPSPAAHALQAALAARQFGHGHSSMSLQACPVEYLRIPPAEDQLNQPGWIAFCKRLQDGARRAGFPALTAAGLTGAFGEMVDNVLQHSERARSGVAGYRWCEGCLEYVVADAGIGVLQSLGKNPDYAALRDAGTALQLALSEGVSSFGRSSGRGFGFRQVFISLANLSGSLRFRSGDHCLVIAGTSPDLAAATLAQNIEYQGFLVSVVCRPSS